MELGARPLKSAGSLAAGGRGPACPCHLRDIGPGRRGVSKCQGKMKTVKGPLRSVTNSKHKCAFSCPHMPQGRRSLVSWPFLNFSSPFPLSLSLPCFCPKEGDWVLWVEFCPLPQTHMLKSKPPISHNVTLLGHGVFTEVIKLTRGYLDEP